jgi:uncharacterized protein (DUF433 family)
VVALGPRKAQPFSLRLPPRLERFVTEEAKRTRRSKGAVVEGLADEAMRCRRFPGIAFRGSDWDRRAWVVGTSLDVWEIVEAFQSYAAIEPMMADSDLTERQIKLTLAYYDEYREEIDAAIVENRRSLDDLRRAYPTIDVIEVDE